MIFEGKCNTSVASIVHRTRACVCMYVYLYHVYLCFYMYICIFGYGA